MPDALTGPCSSMVSPLKEVQRRMIEAALQLAFEQGKEFANADAVDDYLRESHVPEDWISALDRVKFDCCLRSLAARTKEARPLSPSLSNASQANGFERSIDREDLPDDIQSAGPIFGSQKPLNISFFKPRFNEYDVMTAKRCKGSVSYISETIAREHHLDSGSPSIILRWRYTGGPQSNNSFRTRCEIFKPECFPDCHVALGEECGENDFDELEGTGKNSESSNDFQPDDLVYQSSETIAPHDYSLAEQNDIKQTATEIGTEMAFGISEMLVRLKRKAPQQSRAMDNQFKRTRIL
ncbi:hypothetical protein BKA61DRAFT_106991 [Leptodontidium sp. MPI-SDFR-AT-0119]|nr:hypothetical protein BKA61DRAFT_106991 [Leptodontidium sp. MPI-SDFR-AT-0119]